MNFSKFYIKITKKSKIKKVSMFSKQSLYVCGLKYNEINQTKCWCLKAIVRITSEMII